MKKLSSLQYINILAVSIIIVLLSGCIQTDFTYGVVGNPAISSDGKYITVLVAESRGITRQVNGGYRATDYNSSYWLKQYETATGKLLKKKKIIAHAEENNLLLQCYGGYGDNIWLHSNGLKAYNISSLEEKLNEAQLTASNNFSADDFPDDQRFIEQHVVDGYINFTSLNGNQYYIDLTTLKIGNRKDLQKNSTNAINDQLRSLSSGNISYGVRCDTLHNRMYALAKDSNTAANSQPGNNNEGPVYKQLYLFTANYTTGNVGNYRYSKYSNMQQLPGTSYLNGYFLKDCSTNKIIRPKENGLFFILHNNNLGNTAQSILTAVDSSNKTVWQLNTGLSTTLANCVVKANYCMLIGNKHPIIAPHVGNDMLCIINLANGKIQTTSLAD